ncbi:MAG: Hsp20/alpha crystallin family protein [Deltaproteobacteria bacterium]|nr:Hsp20/alpha crystallin family protein [Deltaproteobacteria bacterium]MBF0510581.1 Hsp20/alpha crystallin family protein [Deltaproteobacteria bacterium]MBF0525845.1 Hsp20/alpha crystallin family protein [Deltaproteobacteria bacterium]
MSEKEIQVKDKMELTEQEEHTQPGPVFVPDVDIYEDQSALTLVADMPGVDGDHIEIDTKDNHLIIVGHITPAAGEGEHVLLKEYNEGRFHRKFVLADIIDQEKISATMKNGVLTLVLPKIERAKPRKIAVTIG